MHEDTDRYPDEYELYDQYDPYEAPQPEGPEIVSTSQAVNLTLTLASMSFLFALFLCFADQRSRAVRRFAVQSVGLGVLHVAAGLLCWLLSALLGWIPLVGPVLVILFVALFIAASALVLVLRVRMMLHGYRGIAYCLPVIGQMLRKFE